MGADGHITIHNWDKIKEFITAPRFSEHIQETITRFGGYIYPNPFASTPIEIMIAYSDNIDGFNYHIMTEWFREYPALLPITKVQKQAFFWYLKHNKASFGGFSSENLHQLYEIVHWANNNALVTQWEVWT